MSVPEGGSQGDADAARNEAFAKQYQDEWKILVTNLAELEAVGVEAQAVWDSEFPMLLRDLRVCVFELQDVVTEYLRSKRNRHYEPNMDRQEMRAVLYGIGGENDVFGKKVESAIAKVDSNVRPHFLH